VNDSANVTGFQSFLGNGFGQNHSVMFFNHFFSPRLDKL
jgi:hypothetical protein